jgi:hypothetical protein
VTRVRRARAILLGVLVAAVARADAPVVRTRAAAGPFLVTIFAEPTPLRVGPAVIGALVQYAEGDAPILDARVRLRLEAPAAAGIAPVEVAAATRSSGNRLLYTAPIAFTVAGEWRLTADVQRSAERGALSCDLAVGDAPAPLVELWPYLAAPFVALGLYALHQVLARRVRPV